MSDHADAERCRLAQHAHHYRTGQACPSCASVPLPDAEQAADRAVEVAVGWEMVRYGSSVRSIVETARPFIAAEVLREMAEQMEGTPMHVDEFDELIPGIRAAVAWMRSEADEMGDSDV